ncbi:MAG: hypothetical protein GY801_23060, partial [bacterium]|nr:hypothetical protein [bacterium]
VQAPQTDSDPIITITSEIPAETKADTFTITGKAADDSGIAEVTITRKQDNTRKIVKAERAQMAEEQFSVDVRLHPGKNDFIIEAVNMAGGKAWQTVSIHRKAPQTPGARGEGLGGPPAGGRKPPKPRNLYAVIIGVGDYQDEKIPDLRFTVNDAQGMYDVLTDPQFGGVSEENIQLLLDEDATVQNIKKAIGVWLKRKAREEDTVIIYYAGHGAPEDKETYWVTYDADIESLYASALSNNEISDMMDRIESKRVLTFLDACYSAATVNRSSGTRDIFIEAPLEKFTGEGRVVISASDGQQLSLEMEAYEHGVFTYYLLEALKGEADGLTAEERDGIIEIEEVWNYVRNQVTETAREQGNDQTPKFQGGLTAGIPLTFDREFLEERHRQRQQEIQEKQTTLQELFEQGMFEDPVDFECAYNMVETGKPDKYIDGLLNGKLSAEMFNKLFKCRNQGP